MNAIPVGNSIEEKILRNEKLWLQAHLDLDLDQLAFLMHPDYQIVQPNGNIWNKSQSLTSYREDNRSWEAAECSDLNIRVYSSSALVTGIWKASGENNGEPFDYRARYLSVWLEDNQKNWKLVHDQSLPIP